MKRRISKRKRRVILRRLKFLIVIMFFCVMIFKIKMVDAGSNDSVIMKNKVDGVYAVATVRGEEHLYYLNMYTLNGSVSYCIELGVDITEEIYNSSYDFSISNLSDSKIEYIRNVSYFGYGYLNHNDYKYYMATQEIIWEYLNGINVEWTNVLNVNGERINIDRYKEDILKLVDEYNRGVKFNGYNKGMEVKIEDNIVVSDINNNIKYYELVSSKYCDVEIKDNNIYIKFHGSNVGIGNVILKRKRVYGYDSLLYYQGSSQKLISNGNIDDEIKLEFKIKGKNINIQMKDSVEFKHNNQFDYGGIEFALYDKNKNFLGFVKGDKFGRIFIENMAYGEYYVKQSIYNYAYILNNVYQKIIFDDDEVIYVDVVPVINKIFITKLYGENDYLLREEGIIFDVYNIDGSLYDSFVTDKDGMTTLVIPYGEYMVKQRNSTHGYAKVEDFYVDAKKNFSNGIYRTLVDKKIKSNLVINSKDDVGNLILGNDIKYKIKYKGNYLEVDGISEFGSNKGSFILPDKLDYGEYEIDVINNSKVYKEVVSNVKFNIDDNSNFRLDNGELYLEIDIFYNLLKGSVNVNTVKEIFKVKDNNYYYEFVSNSNVELDLVANSDIIVNGNIVYKKGDKVSGIKTNEDGIYLIEDVYFGSYCLVDINNNSKCFGVDSEEKIDVFIENKLSKGSVVIHNVSSNLEDISGTVMELYDKDNNAVYMGVTNDEGLIKIDNLVYGEYCFKEKSVDDNYLINDDEVCFLLENESVVNLEIVNKNKENSIVSIPNTLSDYKAINKLFILFVSVVGVGIYKFKKNKCN